MLKNEPSTLKLIDDNFNSIYRGVVEDNKDPLKAGRVRVRIWGVHNKKKNESSKEGISIDSLPWAEPAYPIFEGSISGVGLWSVPVQGTHVFVFFENGDYRRPIYFACVPGIQPKDMPSFPKDEGFYDPNQHNLPSDEYKAYPTDNGKPNDEDCDDAEYNELGEPDMAFQAMDKYPFNTVIKTRGGILIELDSSKDDRRIHVKHPSCSYVLIEEDGKVTVKTEKDGAGIDVRTEGSDADIIINAKQSNIYLNCER
jgi:hypothetical protein